MAGDFIDTAAGGAWATGFRSFLFHLPIHIHPIHRKNETFDASPCILRMDPMTTFLFPFAVTDADDRMFTRRRTRVFMAYGSRYGVRPRGHDHAG